MPKIIGMESKKMGLPPGTPIYIGKGAAGKIKIEVIDYSENSFEEKTLEKVEDCLPFKEKKNVTWINVVGIHETQEIEKIANKFGIHPLTIEDIVNTNQRPKMEDFENYVFVVLKMVYYSNENLNFEQISIILGENFVLTFQEKEGDVFGLVRERIRKNKGKIRKMGSDYLAYSLVDAIVDNYFSVLEVLGEKIEQIEDKLIIKPEQKQLVALHQIKRDLLFLRRASWPMREAIGQMHRGGSKLITHTTEVYLRDIYDHTILIIDTIETYRDIISDLFDIYLSSISNKLNEIMKVLTIIATIFIPLTFITGIYGMNFEHMPELKWEYGYYLILLIMAILGISMAITFKKRGWI
ncbi:MAG: magnesium/cobalt transporter CorA [Candidatus Diapherotrites archaeon]|nr:magnesium/cobalt transporter CorA [Candidatus Diapherotrites archaeon]